MKKMKRFIALPIACIAAFSLVACDKTASHSHSYDESEWAKDATKHWHQATCNCENVYADVAGHTDANHDGACDVCGWFDENHTHTYENDWTSDASGHWHKADCFHDVKGDFATHTPNAIGDCTVCGYHVADPVIESVSAALALAETQKSTVKSGKMTMSETGYKSSVSYQYRDGFLLVSSEYNDTYYFSYGTDEVKYLGIQVANGEETAIAATVNHLQGPQINSFYGTEDAVSFGVENLVKDLYSMAQLNSNGDFVTNIDAETNTYSFSFGNQVDFYGDIMLWTVEVTFTLDEKTYAMNSAEITAKQYMSGDLTETDGVYTINDGAEANQTNVLTVNQYDEFVMENPYKPEAILVQDFTIQAYSDDAGYDVDLTESGLTLELGEESSAIYLNKDLRPETAILATAEIAFSGENVSADIYANSGLKVDVQYIAEGGYFYLTGLTAGDYEVTVTVNGVSKTFEVSVVVPVATSISFGEIYDYYGYDFVEDKTSATVSVGSDYELIVILDKGAGVTLTCDNTALTVGTPVKKSLWKQAENDWDDNYEVVAYVYNFSELAEGTYMFTATSEQDSALTATFTLTVEDAQQGGGDDTTTGGSVSVDLTGVSNMERTTLDVELPAGTYAITASDVSDYAVNSGVWITIFVNNEWTAQLDGDNNFTAEDIEIPANATISVGQDLSNPQDFTVTFTSPALGNNTSGVVTPSGEGVQADPYIIAESGNYETTVADGYTYVYYAVTDFVGDVTIKATCDDYYFQYGTHSFMVCDKTLSSTYGEGSATVTLAEGQTLFLKVSVNSEATNANVTFAITLSTEGEEGGDDNDDGTVVAPGTFVVEDNNNGSLTGTYTFEIGEYNAVTVYDSTGEVTTNIIFTQDMGGFWGVSTSGMMRTQPLYDADGNMVTELSGTLYVNAMMNGLYVFDFGGEGGSGDDNTGDDNTGDSGTITPTNGGSCEVTAPQVPIKAELALALVEGTYTVTVSNVSDYATSSDIYITIYVNGSSVAVLKKGTGFTAENIVIPANATIEVGHDLYGDETFTVTFTPVE